MKEEMFPHTRKPLRRQRLRVAEGEASEPRRRAQPQGCGGQSGETPAQRIGAEQHSPAREACLLPRRCGRGWELRLLAGRESGKKPAAAKEARDFFLPLCFLVREERGFRAPPKPAPETGASHGDQRGPQRRARAVAISADPRDGQETLRRLLPPPRSLCASTGHCPHRPSW